MIKFIYGSGALKMKKCCDKCKRNNVATNLGRIICSHENCECHQSSQEELRMKKHEGWISGKQDWNDGMDKIEPDPHDTLDCFCTIICDDCGKPVKKYYHKDYAVPIECKKDAYPAENQSDTQK